MGRQDDAIREGRRAVELKPLSKDATDGAIMLCYLALIYTQVGQTDQAIPLIEQLSKTSGAVDSVDYSITLNDLQISLGMESAAERPAFSEIARTNRLAAEARPTINFLAPVVRRNNPTPPVLGSIRRQSVPANRPGASRAIARSFRPGEIWPVRFRPAEEVSFLRSNDWFSTAVAILASAYARSRSVAGCGRHCSSGVASKSS